MHSGLLSYNFAQNCCIENVLLRDFKIKNKNGQWLSRDDRYHHTEKKKNVSLIPVITSDKRTKKQHTFLLCNISIDS